MTVTPTATCGKGVEKAVLAVIEQIGPELVGYDATEQRLIDQAMFDLDATDNKGSLGANAILGVSLAVAHAASEAVRPPALPLPGRPERAPAARADDEHPQRRVARRLQRRHPGVHDRPDRRGVLLRGAALGRRGLPHPQEGAEDARACPPASATRAASPRTWSSNREALDLILEAIKQAGYIPGQEIALALDVAASEFYKDGKYQFEGKSRSAAEMTEYYEELVAAYPLVSIEDPLYEDDWAGWKVITDKLGDKVQIVGDDLFVTNPERLARGIEEGSANALLVKVNQIGSLTETLDAVEMAQRNGFKCMMSHRSGETEDVTIADLAVAVNCGQIKTGAPARSDRVAKYNQLLRIEEILDDAAVYAGRSAFPRFKG